MRAQEEARLGFLSRDGAGDREIYLRDTELSQQTARREVRTQTYFTLLLRAEYDNNEASPAALAHSNHTLQGEEQQLLIEKQYKKQESLLRATQADRVCD